MPHAVARLITALSTGNITGALNGVKGFNSGALALNAYGCLSVCQVLNDPAPTRPNTYTVMLIATQSDW